MSSTSIWLNNAPQCKYIPHFLNPFISCEHLADSQLDYSKHSCSKCGCSGISLVCWLQSFDICPIVIWQGHKVVHL
jgi:hypothetical protein